MALGTFPDGYYVTVGEVRAEGLSSVPPNDNFIGNRIKKWEAIVERYTGLVFREIDPGEVSFDGNNSDILHFNVPIISFTSLKINDRTTELDPDSFQVFNGRGPLSINDDRHNPKIKLTPLRDSIFTPGGEVFVKGASQRVTATWGFVEADGSTPQPVKDAIIQLVIRDHAGYFDQSFGGATPSSAVPVQRERTDDHEIEYADMQMDITADRYGSLLPRDIRAMLAMYRRPLALGAPEPKRFIPYERTFAIEAF